MKYTLEEQETFVHFDPITKEYIYDTSYSHHIRKILQMPEAFEILDKEEDDGKVIWIRAKFKSDNHKLNIFPRKKKQLTAEALERQIERLNQARQKKTTK